MYGHEAWSHNLRERQRLRTRENKTLTIFEPERRRSQRAKKVT